MFPVLALAEEVIQSYLFLVLHQPEPCRILIPSGHALTKYGQVLLLRTVLAVVVDLPEVVYIEITYVGIIRIIITFLETQEPTSIFPVSQLSPMISHNSVTPAKRDPALTAVAEDGYYSRSSLGEVAANMLSYPVSRLQIS